MGVLAVRDSNAVGLRGKPYSNQYLPYRNPTALTLFKTCGGNAEDHRSGPPPRTRNFLKEHLVHESFSETCTRCSLGKFRVLGGGPDL